MRVKDLIIESQTVSELKVSPSIAKTVQAAPTKMKQAFQTGKAAAGAAAQRAGIGSGIKNAISSFKKGYAQGSGTAASAADQTAAEPTAVSTDTPEVPAKPNAAKFAQKLQTMFDQFVKDNGSIGAPAVKAVLKNMWMQSGGIRAESKK